MMRLHKICVRLELPVFLYTLCLLVHHNTVTGNFICPNEDQCKCEVSESDKIIINCKGKNLIQVPSFTASPTEFYELTLANNDIPHLIDLKFTGLKIKRLDVTNNPLEGITQKAFEGLEGVLEELLLDATTTQAVSFPKDAVQGLTKLKLLQLKNFNVPQLPTGALSDLTVLRDLVIHSSKMSALTAADLAGPRASLELLDFQGNEFTSVPSAALQGLQQPFTLKMAQNRMIRLSSNSFQDVTMLRHVDLSNNAFSGSAVDREAFRTLENTLKTLNMHSCQLSDSSLVAFRPLAALKELILDNNQITTIAGNTFSNMRSLTKLQMHDNRVISISRSTFQGLGDSLSVLHLSDNARMAINSDTFMDFNSLTELHLDGASASSLNDNSFDSLAATLKFLSFKNAGLTSSDWTKLGGLSKLETLWLSRNNLNPVPDMIFEDFSMLQELHLSDNNIVDLPQRVTHGLQGSLKALDLQNNDMSTVRACALHPDKFTRLDIFQLNLRDNPLKCDCHLVWLHRWLMDNKDDFRFNVVSWQCVTGELFRELEESDLTCDPPESEEECEDLRPTTPAPTTPSSTTPSSLRPVLININSTTHNSILLSWEVYGTYDIRYFIIEYYIPNGDGDRQEKQYSKDSRSATIQELESATTYKVCVAMVMGRTTFITSPWACSDATTLEAPDASSNTAAELQIILGAAFGALAFVIIVVVIVCCICKRRGKDDSFDGGELGKFPAERGTMPHAGYNSKRFSRQKPRNWEVHNAMQNIKNKDRELEQKLEGFSPEERDRILQLLRQQGGSTISVVSNASSQRYVPDPPPMRNPNAEGYMNPVDLGDEYSGPYRNVKDKHEYEEIPADTYDQIPCDSFI